MLIVFAFAFFREQYDREQALDDYKTGRYIVFNLVFLNKK